MQLPHHLLPEVTALAKRIVAFVEENATSDPTAYGERDAEVSFTRIGEHIPGFLAGVGLPSATRLGIEFDDDEDFRSMLWNDRSLSGVGAAAVATLLISRQICLEIDPDEDLGFWVWPGRFANFSTTWSGIPCFLHPAYLERELALQRDERRIGGHGRAD